MWKYIGPDEAYNNTKSKRLYHSDTYLGEDFSDGIKHWKYLKKERRNGRWVYYYRDDELDKLRSDKTRTALNAAVHESKNKVDANWKKIEKSKNYNKLTVNDVYGSGPIHTSKSKDQDMYKAQKATADYAKATAAFNNYDSKTKARQVVGVIAAKTLSSASAVASKGKSILSKIFKKKK